MLTSTFFGATLLISPPGDYEQAQLDLQTTAESISDLPPEQAIATLERALAESLRHPEKIRSDTELANRLARARVALAWVHLADGDVEAASAAMDGAIRSAGTNALPLSGLGPDIRKLHDERRKALEAEGTATISVDCEACEVVIDEAKSSNPSAPLLLGIHRVWVFDPFGEFEPEFEVVTLEQAEGTATLSYPDAPEPVAPSTVGSTDAMPEPREQKQSREPKQSRQPKQPRKQNQSREQTRPRWPKIAGMSVGAGLMIAGGVLLSLDGKCRDGSKPTADNVDTCPDVMTSAAPAYGLLAVGGGLLVGATVWLSIDEARAGRARSTSAMLGWTMRF